MRHAPAPRRAVATFGALAALLLAAPAHATETPALDTGLAAYARLATQQIDAARDEARVMQQRLAAGDMAGARRAWLESHVAWERSETFSASLYPDLDEAIDAWPDGKSGYHLIEARLFGDTPETAKDAAADLVRSLDSFAKELRAHGLTAQGLLDGTAQLAFETGENKATGGESTASGSSYADMRNNVQGIQAVFTTVLGPTLKQRDAAAYERASISLARMAQLLAAKDLAALDQTEYGHASESFAAALRDAAVPLGLQTPKLGD
jgi:iron uptake system component EfeO